MRRGGPDIVHLPVHSDGVCYSGCGLFMSSEAGEDHAEVVQGRGEVAAERRGSDLDQSSADRDDLLDRGEGLGEASELARRAGRRSSATARSF